MVAGEALGELPESEQLAFQKAQGAYDDRQYEESARILDELVAAHPTCVEILAMQGLVLRNIEARHAEALPALKAAIRYNVKSAVAWHALAGYHRMESNYEQALKSYKQAVVLAQTAGKSSGVHPSFMLKDLGRVQLYLRKYHDFVKTCQQLFIANRNSKLDWLAVPVAVDLCDRPREAAAMLNAWFDLPPQVQNNANTLWTTQMHFYGATLLEQAGQYEAARNQLEGFIIDDTAGKAVPDLITLLARLYLRNKDYARAKQLYTNLIDYLPENADYLIGYVASCPEYHDILPSCYDLPASGAPNVRLYPDILTTNGVRSSLYVTEPAAPAPPTEVREMNPVDGTCRIAYNLGDLWRQYWLGRVLSGANVDGFVQEFEALAEKYPSSDAISTFPWAFIPADHPYLRRSMTAWFLKKLRKGAMCLIMQYQLLMVTDVAARAKEVSASLDEAFAAYMDANKAANSPTGVGEGLYYCAKGVVAARIHRKYDEGLALIQKAIDILPTVIDFWTHKATVLDDMGEEEEALKLYKQCAEMDSADKHARATAVRKLAAAGRIEEACRYHLAFNKTADNKQVTPFDSQDQELELAVCRGLLRRKMYDQVIKRMYWVLRRLGQQQEDVQDFHSYAIRIGNLATYPDYVRYLERIFGLRSAQAGLNVLMTACIALMDSRRALNDEEHVTPCSKAVCAAEPESVDALLDSFLCEIPSRFVLQNVGAMSAEEIGTVILEPLLASFRDDVAFQSFGVLRHSYQFHTRRAFLKPYVVKFCLQRVYQLAGEDWYHPKALPILLHNVWCGNAWIHEEGEQPSPTLPEAPAFSQYLENAIAKFNGSNQINDRYALIQGIVYCLLARSREQQQQHEQQRQDTDEQIDGLRVLRTALDEAIEKIKANKKALIDTSGYLGYTRGIAKIQRELSTLQEPDYQQSFF